MAELTGSLKNSYPQLSAYVHPYCCQFCCHAQRDECAPKCLNACPIASLACALKSAHRGRCDPISPELALAQAEALQRELEGEHSTALERILCERVVTTRLIVSELGTFPPPNVSETQHNDEMVTRAHQRLIHATLTLAKVRRLLRPQIAQVNIAEAGAQQFNMAPIVPMPSSE